MLVLVRRGLRVKEEEANRQGVFGERIMGRQTSKIRRRALVLFLLLWLSILCSCGEQEQGSVVCVSDLSSAYTGVLSRTLPTYTAEQQTDSVFDLLQRGAAVEVSDIQAVPAIENGVAAYWYPQYLATVVIAVDRDQTDAVLGGWRDLAVISEIVGFDDRQPDAQLLMAAMSYALEGEAFTLDRATELLSLLADQDRLLFRSLDAPVLICFDDQAAALNRSGKNFEIVIPSEGTLSFERGLLSNTELTFAPETDTWLLEAGFRLPDGRCDSELYPDGAAYAGAARYRDYEHLTAVCQNTTRELRREVRYIRLYSSADGREHHLFALVFMVLVIGWVGLIVRRVLHRGVRRATLCTGCMLIAWSLLRVIKYLLPQGTVNRYCWYGFYFFLLALPLVLLYLGWAVDKPDTEPPPRWYRRVACGSALLLLMVFTNDWHQWVFRLEPSLRDWSGGYSYGAGFYAVAAGVAIPAVWAMGLLLAKSGKSPNKGAFVLPVSLVVLVTLYAAGYILRVPFAWESDLTIVTGGCILVFVEALLQTRLIPVNSQYGKLFQNAPLGMRILDAEGDSVLASANAVALPDGAAAALQTQPQSTFAISDDLLLHAAPIIGGTVVWQEDIGALNRLQRELRRSVERLCAANEMLAREESLRRELHDAEEKEQLFTQLEREIASRTRQLADLSKELQLAKDQQTQAAKATLLLCYIKRRCNLFFREQEQRTLAATELQLYIDELAGLAAHDGIQIAAAGAASRKIRVRSATLLYDFFFTVVEWAAASGCRRMLQQLVFEDGRIILRVLPDASAVNYSPPRDLQQAIDAAGGVFARKDLDEETGISLAFPEGGGGHA